MLADAAAKQPSPARLHAIAAGRHRARATEGAAEGVDGQVADRPRHRRGGAAERVLGATGEE
ncbi:hypothetical protein FraQA3DRAFT_1944 [Frankia sp. QA3]|nr:hypothetical protein FraQA3DRAFT_1944 [Frankia sp. QA3]